MVVLARRGRDAGPTRQPPAAPGRGAQPAPVRRGRARRRARSLRRRRCSRPAGRPHLAAHRRPRALAQRRRAAPGRGSPSTSGRPGWSRGAAWPARRWRWPAPSSRRPAATRSPSPGILGITGGAGLGAVIVVTGCGARRHRPRPCSSAAVVGALVAFALVYGLTWRRGLDADRLVLVGIGVWYGTTALTTFLLVRSNPWDTPRIFTWLSGTTYGRTLGRRSLPGRRRAGPGPAAGLLVRRELDLLALDDDTPRLVGHRPRTGPARRARTGAPCSTAISVTAVGVVGFVGLVAPHAARALVGGQHAARRSRSPCCSARSCSAWPTPSAGPSSRPAQVPAGLVVALIGAPYFVYLLARSRA